MCSNVTTEDARKICQEVQRRGITRLCHFTQSRKLYSILVSGLLSRSLLEDEFSDLLTPTDMERFDKRLDYISCSIEYPNTWYLKIAQKNNPEKQLFNDWVVLYLSVDLIWAPKTLFSPCNAAYSGGRLLQPGYDSFKKLFERVVHCKQPRIRPNGMLPCCPTDDQAEVMIYQCIHPEYIWGIAVESEEQANKEYRRLRFLFEQAKRSLPPLKWFIAPDIFPDHTGWPPWSSMVRQGQRPQEVEWRPL